jgi:[ribosomal protein S5]-alanine N-acetyltransferase
MTQHVATIDTRRFVLRPLVRADAAALFPTLSDDQHCRYLSRSAFADEEELAGWLLDPTWDGRTWVGVDRTTGTVAARFVVVPTREPGMSEIGYITCAGWQRQGVAGECLTTLISHLFAAEDHRRLIAEIDAENTASIALAERLGFIREAHLRQHETTHKGLCDILIYGLLRSEWPAPA